VLFSSFYGDMGGGEFALLAHVKRLLAVGTEVHVCLFCDGPFRPTLASAGCQIHVLPQRLNCGPRGALLVAIRLLPKLARVFRLAHPRYLLTYTHQEMPFVMCAARLAGIPAAFRDQGRPALSTEHADWGRKRLARLTRREKTAVVPTTKAQTEFLLKLGVSPERLRQVYLGVDPAPFDCQANCRGRVFDEFGIPANASVVGIFGRLIALKGHAVLFNAVRKLARDDVHVLVVGGTQLNVARGTEYFEGLKRLTSELRISDRVHFTGFRSDVPSLMSACDVVCSASEWETFGLTLVEAMMSGKPVVATDVSGPREIIVPGETGYLYPAGDSHALAQHLVQLFGNRLLRQQMGKAGRHRAMERFEMNRNLQQLDDTITELLLTTSEQEQVQR
jgi:glycosyltransferase involved in cell wall biosynthesis